MGEAQGVVMKEIRNLLLDVRAALRKADPKFEQTPLRELLDDTIIALGQAGTRAAEPPPAEAETPTAQRVAYAWQSVARELRHTHPDLYAKLSEKVLARLDVEVLDDPADEIQTLQARLAEREAALARTAAELAALRTALATAVPLPDTVGRTEADLAQERLQLLLQAASQGGGLPKPAPTAEASYAPTRTTLLAVAEGQRTLTPQEREWCIGEAMVLTGFQRSHAQLVAQGDAALARLVLEGGPPA